MIDEIREKFDQAMVEFSRHAVDRMMLRVITVDDLWQVIASGMVIEDYRDDKYGPSCLVLGITSSNRPLHVQCTYPSRPLIKVITVYEPDPTEWIDFKQRKVESDDNPNVEGAAG